MTHEDQSLLAKDAANPFHVGHLGPDAEGQFELGHVRVPVRRRESVEGPGRLAATSLVVIEKPVVAREGLQPFPRMSVGNTWPAMDHEDGATFSVGLVVKPNVVFNEPVARFVRLLGWLQGCTQVTTLSDHPWFVQRPVHLLPDKGHDHDDQQDDAGRRGNQNSSHRTFSIPIP